MSEREQAEGYDHDEGAVYEEAGVGDDQDAGGEEPQFDDGGSPETSDGQIRPADVAPGDGMGHGYSSVGDGPEGELHASGHEGGKAHTPAEDGHPDIDPGSSRSARDLGGPSLAPDDVDEASDTRGAAKGDIATKGMEPHE